IAHVLGPPREFKFGRTPVSAGLMSVAVAAALGAPAGTLAGRPFAPDCLLAELGPVDDGKKFGTFAGAVHREALPVAAESQIGEETSRILMEMQICFALDVEYPRSPLD